VSIKELSFEMLDRHDAAHPQVGLLLESVAQGLRQVNREVVWQV
jgi:hypothetical protein